MLLKNGKDPRAGFSMNSRPLKIKSFEKQTCRGVIKKRCSEKMQQICRTPISKCDFNKAVFA